MNPFALSISDTRISFIHTGDAAFPPIAFLTYDIMPFGTDENKGWKNVPTLPARIAEEVHRVIDAAPFAIFPIISVSFLLIPIIFSSFSLGPASGNNHFINSDS